MHVTIVEVGPRDGLQNDAVILPVATRLELVKRLIGCGLPRIEVGSFVNPNVVPAMAGTDELVRLLLSDDGRRTTDDRGRTIDDGPSTMDNRSQSEQDASSFSHRPSSIVHRRAFTALVPNLRGYQQAVAAGMGHVRLVVAASGEMNRRNFRVSPAETMAAHGEIAKRAQADGVAFGGIIGTAFGCPYEGAVDPGAVADLAAQFAAWGADEVVLADTTGMATPRQVREVLDAVAAATATGVPLGGHFHNTRNTGYANALAAIERGATILDASVAGIGGCPFAPRAVGNIATDDLVHLLNGMGIETGVSLEGLLETNRWLAGQLGRELPGMVEKAGAVFAGGR